MEKLFIAPLNPFHFYGDLPDWYWFNHAQEECYYQKVEKSDSTTLQILSEAEAFSIKIKDFETNKTVSTISATKLNTNIVGQDFDVYEANISYSSLDGYYYLEVEWVDGTSKSLYSVPFHVADSHEGTLLFEYKNSENDFSVIFAKNTVFKFRVEGTIQNFTPSSNDEIYNDQNHNPTLLYSTPFQKWTLFIGNAAGVPDWVSDKVNRIMSCDIIKIDGTSFNKEEGSSWEILREDDYPFSGMQLDIIPTVNHFMQTFETIDDDEGGGVSGEAVLLRKSKSYLNKSGDFEVPSIFENRTVLDYIAIQRAGNDATSFSVGTTPGGIEVGVFSLSANDNNYTYTIRKLFNAPTTLYITGGAGIIDYFFVYEKLDKVGGGGSGGGVPSPTDIPIRTIWLYGGSFAQLQRDFDIITGLGREDSEWADWAMADGRNGTFNISDRYVKGADVFGNRAPQTGGTHTKTLTVDNLPPHVHTFKRIDVWRRSFKGENKGPRTLIEEPGGTRYVDRTNATGLGEQFNIEPRNIAIYYVQKIR